jgi:MFS transporter, AAHS family, 4-hydroxybenzoate transporter
MGKFLKASRISVAENKSKNIERFARANLSMLQGMFMASVSAKIINVGQIIDDSKLNKLSVRVILLCGLIMMMDGYDYGIISVAAPNIMQDWHVGTKAFGGVFSAAFFGYMFGAIICGALSDAIGRKKTLILAACFFSVGTLLVYFSNSVSVLIPMRIFAGLGTGGAVPCAITLTSEFSPSKGRGKYVSVMYSGFLIGYVLARYIAGFLFEHNFGWRSLFLLGFFAPVLVIGILIFMLPESARWLSTKYRTENQRQHLVKIMGAMKPEVEITAETRFESGAPKKEKRSFQSLFAGRLAWVTPIIWAYYLISSIPVFFISSWAPVLLVEKGFTKYEAAYINGNNGILVAVGCLLSGFYFDKFGFRWGSILHAVACVFLILMAGTGAMGFVLMLFASAFFINSAHMDVTILAPIVYPSKCRNQGAGTAIAVARIGAMAGPYIGGYLLATALPRDRLMAFVSIPLLIAAVLCYIAGRQYDFYFAPPYAGKSPAREKAI